VAVTPAVRRPQTGRCGVLTRIPVGAAAVAGPGRFHSPAELAGPDPTTRHGDEAAASCSCRFPVPFGVSRALTVTSCNVLRCCTRLEVQLAMPQLSIVALPSPSLFQPCCCIPCNTPAPPVVPFALIPTGGRFLLPQGIIRPAPAGRHPSPSRPAGRTRPSGPGPLYTVRRDHGGHGGHGAPGVTGDARPMVTSALLQDARGRAARAGPGGVDCAAADALFATVPPVPREDVCGVESLRPGPGGDVIVRHGFLMGEVAHHPRQLFMAPRGTAGVPGPQARASTGVELGAARGLPPLCSAQGYCAVPA
jgi:hypothetical protein